MIKKKYTLSECPIDIYVQKSIKFLYPLLKIAFDSKILPLQTFLAWEGEVAINSCKLSCVYDVKEEVEFTKFERTVLRGHELFSAFFDVENNRRVYIFDLKQHKTDVFLFLKGKYSQLSEETKLTILNFYNLNKFSKEYIDSFVNPENYFEQYAKLLDVPVRTLRKVGELCDPFNRTKETLCIKKVAVVNNMDNLMLH